MLSSWLLKLRHIRKSSQRRRSKNKPDQDASPWVEVARSTSLRRANESDKSFMKERPIDRHGFSNQGDALYALLSMEVDEEQQQKKKNELELEHDRAKDDIADEAPNDENERASVEVGVKNHKQGGGSGEGMEASGWRDLWRMRTTSLSAELPSDVEGRVKDLSVAVVKVSRTVYKDFRNSMYELIIQEQLQEAMDMEELLYCYLSLNSPQHYTLIQQAFSDVWTELHDHLHLSMT